MSKYLIRDEGGFIYYRGRVYPFYDKSRTYNDKEQVNRILKKLGGTWYIEVLK